MATQEVDRKGEWGVQRAESRNAVSLLVDERELSRALLRDGAQTAGARDVELVPDEHDVGRVAVGVRAQLREPGAHGEEGGLVAQVEHQQEAHRVATGTQPQPHINT